MWSTSRGARRTAATLLAVSALAVAGCGGPGADEAGGGDSGGDRTLTIWIMEGTNPDARPFFDELSTAFRNQTGASLDVQFVPWASAHDKFVSAVGYIINTFLAAARQSINLTLNTILPFMAYVSLLLGFVIYTGVAKAIGNLLTPLSSNPFGLIVIGVIVALPFLSPILGPGAAVAQIVGVLMGTQIATGALPVQYALPTLFAIDGQVGCDFIPVGLGLGEAKVETVEIGTPAVLFSRLITSPLAVIIAYLASFGL